MPAPTRAVRTLILVAVGGVLVASVLAVPGSASARDADRAAPPPPPSYAGLLARGQGGDIGNPGYHYAAAQTQRLPTRAKGLMATLTVHRPRQVRGLLGQHSVSQIAIGNTHDGSYLEAGWRQGMDGPRLFVYWRPATGANTCYNACGFRPRGPGIRPGAQLSRGSEITIGFKHIGDKWWLKVNGEKSGFYPDSLWQGAFRGTDFAQLYGEVYVPKAQKLCADMGNGMPAWKPKAASISNVRWIGGPAILLRKSPAVREVHDYFYKQTGPNSFRYGGPGEC